ncbi:MAG: HAMP domain-containing sensor histidine kinase [Bryobacteraceae bacterium]
MPHQPAPGSDPDPELDRLRRAEANSQLFARMIAHDLNNMLGGVLGHASLIEALAEQDEIREAAGVISQAALRATDLVKQLYAFSGQSTVRMETVDLAAVVNEVAGLLSRGDGGRLRVSVDLQSPSAPVAGDPAQIYQMVLNLAVNARDAMPEGGRLHLAVRTGRPTVELVVADDGPGIPAELLGRIFEPFFSANPSGRGTGLGLAIVHRVVTSHGGAIDVASRPGAGAVFTIRLPAKIV